MKLSKYIPGRTKTIQFNWCKKDWMEMTQKYRDIRAKIKRPKDKCFWCGHAFLDGEMMALAQPKKGRNELLCPSCADELLRSGGS
ncbi:MAG: hypothetical protein JRI80_04785 [Deltaproteobacteria bacterium]|nr:hypothetical protein [Deltaproteobacteria bacterium]